MKSVEPAGVEPVYNLKVLQAESFFAGESGLLVHDNSEVQPVTKPFDAAPELAASSIFGRILEIVGLIGPPAGHSP